MLVRWTPEGSTIEALTLYGFPVRYGQHSVMHLVGQTTSKPLGIFSSPRAHH